MKFLFIYLIFASAQYSIAQCEPNLRNQSFKLINTKKIRVSFIRNFSHFEAKIALLRMIQWKSKIEENSKKNPVIITNYRIFLLKIPGNPRTGFGICQGVMVVFQFKSAKLRNGVQPVIWQESFEMFSGHLQ